MVILLSLQNRKTPIQLFNKNKSDHLMIKSHWRQSNFFFADFVDWVGKTVCATHGEYQLLNATVHTFLHPLGKFYGRKTFSVFIK